MKVTFNVKAPGISQEKVAAIHKAVRETVHENKASPSDVVLAAMLQISDALSAEIFLLPEEKRREQIEAAKAEIPRLIDSMTEQMLANRAQKMTPPTTAVN